jgi:hypothetical protein
LTPKAGKKLALTDAELNEVVLLTPPLLLAGIGVAGQEIGARQGQRKCIKKVHARSRLGGFISC